MKDIIGEYGGFLVTILMAAAVNRVLAAMLQVLTTCKWAA